MSNHKTDEERKRPISFSLSSKDKEMIQRVQEQYHLNSMAEAIMFSIKHAAAGRIAMAGQKIVSSLDGTAHIAAQEKLAAAPVKKPTGLGIHLKKQ